MTRFGEIKIALHDYILMPIVCTLGGATPSAFIPAWKQELVYVNNL